MHVIEVHKVVLQMTRPPTYGQFNPSDWLIVLHCGICQVPYRSQSGALV